MRNDRSSTNRDMIWFLSKCFAILLASQAFSYSEAPVYSDPTFFSEFKGIFGNQDIHSKDVT